MVPNTQPPRFVTGSEFTSQLPSRLPDPIAHDVAKIMAAAIPILLNLQGWSDAMTDLGFQAELLQGADNTLAEEVQNIGDEALLVPGEGFVDKESAEFQAVAGLFAKNINLSNSLAGTKKNKENVASEESSSKENAKEASAKTASETKKIVVAPGDEGLDFSRLFEKGSAGVNHTSGKQPVPPNDGSGKPAEKGQELPAEKEGKETAPILKQHEWRHFKAGGGADHKHLASTKNENADKQPGAATSHPALAKKNQEPEISAKVQPPIGEDQEKSMRPEPPADAREKQQGRRGEAEKAAAKRIEPDKVIKPRMDLIPPLVNKEEPDIPFKYHHPDLLKQPPVAPEQPFTREGILRYAHQNKNAKLKQDEGYRFGDLIFMVFCAVICGAKNSVDICRYLQKQEKFFKIWLGFKNNIPPFRLFWFLLNRLHPHELSRLLKEVLGQKLSDLAVHVRVWESNRGLILGELNTDHASQAHLLLEALAVFDLYGAVMTLDLPVPMPALFRQIKRGRGDFILTLYPSFGDVHDKVMDFFQRDSQESGIEKYKHTIEDPQSLDMREIWVSEEMQTYDLEDELSMLRSSIKLHSEFLSENKRLSTARCYVSSLAAKAEDISKTLRVLSGLENKVEWLADCDFWYAHVAEFESDNMRLLQHITAQALLKHQSGSESLEALRKRASQDNLFLREVMSGLEFQEEDLAF